MIVNWKKSKVFYGSIFLLFIFSHLKKLFYSIEIDSGIEFEYIWIIVKLGMIN